MDEKKLEEFAILDSQIRLLTEQREKLRDAITNDLAESVEQAVVTSFGKFSITRLKTWTYSSKVTDLEEKFKARKATEQSTGEATYEEKVSLRFTPAKI